MSSVTVSVVRQPIAVAVSGNGVSVQAGSLLPVAVDVSGGIGPQGPQGVQGPQGMTALAAASDVEFEELSSGDVLRYEGARWRNYREANLVDGGNW